MPLNARNISRDDLFDQLAELHARKVDVVLPATALYAKNGQVEVTDQEPVYSEYGVTSVNGWYQPLDTFQEHLSDKLGVDLRYLRKLAERRPDLWDSNVNGWISGGGWIDPTAATELDGYRRAEPDKRNFLFRGYAGGNDGTVNEARGLLSDSYLLIDNIDVLTAVLAGINAADVNGGMEVASADLNDRRMYARFIAPQVAVGAQELLRGYRNPFSDGEQRAGGNGWTVDRARAAAQAEGLGFKPGSEPLIWAGFEVSNSELGGGAFSLTPRAQFQICRNGLKITADIDRKVHLGSRQERGVVRWSDDTKRKELELIQAKTRDAVATFLSADYWRAKVAELAAKADKPVTDPVPVVTQVAKALSYSEGERDAILRMFIKGGQMSSGGVMNAVTAAAQTLPDADRAATLENDAVKVLDLV